MVQLFNLMVLMTPNSVWLNNWIDNVLVFIDSCYKRHTNLSRECI